MRLEPFSKSFFGDNLADDFNLDAAVSTYQWYMDTDKDEADMLLSMFMSDTVSKCMDEYGDVIDAHIQKNVGERLKVVKESIKKGIINKSMTDDAVDAAVAAVDLIMKADEYTTEERSRNAGRQTRGPGGRFTAMGKTTINSAVAGPARETHRSFTDGANKKEQFAVLASPNGMRNLGQYQQAYDEIANALGQFDQKPAWAEVKTRKNGKENVNRVSVGDNPDSIIDPIDFYGDNEVKEINWYNDQNESPYAAGYVDPVAAAGSGLVGYQQRRDDNGVAMGESGATRSMRHISNVAWTAEEMGLDVGLKAKAAIAAGKMIGDFGPEAENVFGPGIRRAAYRYRGTEKDIDKDMLRSISESIGKPKTDTDVYERLNEARDDMMVPRITTVNEFGQDVEVAEPSAFLKYWQNRLPDVKLLDLQTNSGAMAPSEGVVFDRAGRPVTQAVGYGDDHYLPFNLRKLGKAKGGEYLRTRTLGGPTSEDLYAGLMSGTRATTVVSHSGIFTIEFDPSFRGARRLNNKAGRMKGRYEKLLDSLDAEKARLNDIPADRKYELREQAKAEVPGDYGDAIKERSARYSELIAAEQEDPQPSQATIDEWTDEFVLNQGDDFTDPMGEPLGVDQLKAEISIKTGQKIDTNDQLITAMGAADNYSRYLEKKKREYSSDLRPLRLNGEGYYNALKALKEQFPYYISNVRWTPPTGDSVKATDRAYVKPNSLRGDKVYEGYWNPEVEGFKNQTDKKLLNTGKRRASTENYSNAASLARLARYPAPAKKQEEEAPPGAMGASTPSEGGVGTAAAPITPTRAATPVGRSSRTPSGVAITPTLSGPLYSGFRPMRVPPASANLTDYQKIQQAMKLRRAIKNLGPISYRKENGGTAKFHPWDGSDENPMRQYPSLMYRGDDDEFLEKLTTDDVFREEVLSNAKSLYETGNSSSRGGEAAVVSAVSGKGAFNGIVDNLGVPKAPTSASVLVAGLSSGSKKQYDFTSGRLDGSYYLSGLTKDEYEAAWRADADINNFTNSAESKFGYQVGWNTKTPVFNALTKQFGQSMQSGLDQTQEWRSDIRRSGGVSRIKSHKVVKYGDKEYTAYNVDALETEIAKDALALAKMKQIRGQFDTYAPEVDERNEMSLEEIQENPDGTFTEKVDYDNPGVLGDLRTPTIDTAQLEQSRRNLDALVGLGSAKDEFNALVTEAKVGQQRKAAGLPAPKPTMHLVFTGNPGTGKTTVAEELGKSYKAMGLIPTDKFTVATRADLVGQYAGHTAAKVRKAFNDSKGGVLFVDEAYGLVNGDNDSFGFEAVDELVAQSEANRDNTVVILAGYPEDMDRLMTANPGLKSRFPKTIAFPDYSEDELKEISSRNSVTSGYQYTPQGRMAVATVMQKIRSAPNYSNARDVRNFDDTLRSVQSARVMREFGGSASKEDLMSITDADVKNASRQFFRQRTGGTAA